MGGREGGSSVALYMLDGSTLRAAGQVNGIATLDASGRVPTDQLPSSVYYYQGMWNASTDTPHLAGTTPTIGYAWSVSVAGTTTLGAISSWAVGDFAVYGALGWSKIPAGGVQTFNGRSGAVVPVAGDYDGLALNLAAASSFVAPASAAAAPTTAAQVAFDTTAKHLKVGDGSSSLTVVDSSSIGVTVQAQSSVLSTLAGNGTPGTFGLARLLDANQAAAQSALGLGSAAYISSAAGGDLSGTLPSPTVAKVAGVTPGAGGLAVLDDADAPAMRTTLGLGTIATQNANNVAITGGSVTGITDLAVADGGTGASAAAGARDNIVWASAAAIDPSSPYTVAAGVDRVTFASSKTLAPRALSNYADGQTILVTNSSASTITVTITPADGTIDGSSSVALSVLAHGVVGCQRVSASAWVSLQPGGLSVNGVKMYLSGGAWYAAPVNVSPATGAITIVGSAVAMSAEGTSYSESLSGTTMTLTGPLVGNTGAIQSNSRRWYVALSDLGITLTSPSTRWASMQMQLDSYTDHSEARSGTVDLGSYMGVGSTTALIGVGFYRPASGSGIGVDEFATSASAFTSLGTSITTVGILARHAWPTNSGHLYVEFLDSAGAATGGGAGASGTGISGSNPTHLVIYLRSTASASGAVYSNPRFLWTWGSATGGSGL